MKKSGKKSGGKPKACNEGSDKGRTGHGPAHDAHEKMNRGAPKAGKSARG